MSNLIVKIKNKIKLIKNINFKQYFQNNSLFVVTVVTLLLNSTILRFITVKNYFDFRPIIADLAMVLIVCSFVYLLKPKKQIIYLMIVSIILSLICMINSLYYTFYTSFASVSLLVTSLQAIDVSDAIVQNVLQVKDFIFLFQPLVILFTYINLNKNNSYYKHCPKREQKYTLKTITGAFVLLIIFFLSLTSIDISRLIKQWNREFLVMKVGLYTYQTNDFFRSLEPRINSIFGYDEVARKVKTYYAERELDLSPNKYTNIFKGKNILTIHAESIQSFAMDLTFNDQEVTPTLNRLAKEGLNFTNFYAQVGAGTSSDTEFTLNTSLLPVSSGTVFVSYWDRLFITIPKLLKDQNYYSFSMHGNNGTYWNRLVVHREMGYNRMYHKKDYEIDEKIGLGLSDRSFFRQSIPMIKEISKEYERFYGTMIMLTNHTPFDEVDLYGDFPVDIKIPIINEDGFEEVVSAPYMEGTLLGNYFKSVHYADLAIGEFIEGLDEQGLLDDTVIVIYGDHDARLPRKEYTRLYNYDPYTNALLNKEDPNYIPVNYYTYELNRKVPFIIWSKNSKANGEIDKVMGMYDVLPTLGNMFDFQSPYQLGHDIFNIDENIVVFPNGNWLTDNIYYNNQKQEYLLLKEGIIGQEYIDEFQQHASLVLEVSNSIILYDYIRKQQEIDDLMKDYKGE